jgi:ElaB/YqjD/DUF883 family membrane-anchored ribosome-binding protein
MDNEQEIIRQQMEDTRTALKEKLETLEHQVVDTVQGATEAVSDTVETVKETVKETVETVKETVEETVENVKETFNLTRHVQEHPWPAFACATVLGFIGGRLLNRTRPQGVQVTAPALPQVAALYRNGEQAAAAPSNQASPPRGDWWSWVAEHYSDELAKARGLAVATVGATVRDMLTADVSPEFADRIKEVIDGFTTKLGGKPIKGPILKSSPTGTGATERAPEEAGYAPRWERPARVTQR